MTLMIPQNLTGKEVKYQLKPFTEAQAKFQEMHICQYGAAMLSSCIEPISHCFG